MIRRRRCRDCEALHRSPLSETDRIACAFLRGVSMAELCTQPHACVTWGSHAATVSEVEAAVRRFMERKP